MRLATVNNGTSDILVADLGEGHLLDLSAAAGGTEEALFSMQALIEGGEEALARARELVEIAPHPARIASADVSFRAPLPRPVQMRDCLVFEEHLINSFERATQMTGKEFAIPDIWYKQPIYYKANRFSVIGDGQDVRWPAYSKQMDFELELAIVIGTGGCDISAEDAPKHIFGYTIFNDMSARDAQMLEMPGQLGPAKGKDFDTGNILGPFIVTADEIAHPVALDMEAKVNGEVWGGGNSGAMHHSFADIIAHISASETLHPGEVIGSGTVGTGCGLELGRFLEDGDVIELTVERIGTLKNRIVKS
ncbi:fumarylacetoacetate hydrolase family protein [Sulfitobacter sp. HNIBRBA3233]|uniref:fumarylacetoacetate hydrolase family protein n=1 Tax=Sulfitobacter marinivivus TaxID=3158558 RepID=UPI0032DE6BA0